MNIHNGNSGFIWIIIKQPRLKIDLASSNLDYQVIMKFVIQPLGPGFGDLVNSSSALHKFKHQLAKVAFGITIQVGADPFDGDASPSDVSGKIPIAQRLSISCQ